MTTTVETATIGTPTTTSALATVPPNFIGTVSLTNPNVTSVRLYDGPERDFQFVSVTVGALSLHFTDRAALRAFIGDLSDQLAVQVETAALETVEAVNQ